MVDCWWPRSVGALVAWFGILGYVFFGSSEQIDKNRTALTALCAQRDDLDARIASTRRLLQEHPRGAIFGIPRQLIVDGLRQSERTRRNLGILEC